MLKTTDPGGGLGQSQDAIYNAAVACRDLFDSTINQIMSGKRPLKELQQRFWLWSNNSGVFAEPFISLDARLQEHEEPRAMILRLLGLIQKNLEAMARLDEEFRRDDNNREPEEQHEQSQAWSVVDGESMTENKHLQGSFFGISGALERLTRLSVLISKASQNNRSARVEAFREKRKMDFAGFEELTNLIIKNKYPMISDSLKLQLTRSIVYRRQSIVYHQHREAKYQRERKRNETATKNNTPGESMLGTRTMQPAQAAAQNHQEKSSFTGFTPLDGSEFNRQHVALGQSKTESTASVGAADVCYPRPPRPKDEAVGYIDCRYCSKKVERRIFGSPVLWRKHVDDDLKPFFCVSEQCTDPAVGFSKYSSWRKHMEEEHGTNWIQYNHDLPPLESKSSQAPDDESAICPLCQTPGDRLEDGKTRTKIKHEPPQSIALASAPKGSSPRKNNDRQVHFGDEPSPGGYEERVSLIEEPAYSSGGLGVAQKMLSRHIAAHLQTLCFQTLEAGLADGDICENSEHGSESLRTATESFGGLDRDSSDLSDVSLPFDEDSGHLTPVTDTPNAFDRLRIESLKSDSEGPFVGDWLRNLDEVSISAAENSHRLHSGQDDHVSFHGPSAGDLRQHSPETQSLDLEDPAIATDETPRPELVSVLSGFGSEKGEDLRDLVYDRLVSGSDGRQFLPLDDLENLISLPNVRQILKSLNTYSDLEVEKYVNDVCNTTPFGNSQKTSRKKIFAILVMIDHVGALPSFISENMFDVHLPFEHRRKEGKRPELVFKPALNGVSVRFEGSSSWKTSKMWEFNDKQWQVMSPFFDMQSNKPRLYSFDDRTVLPIVQKDWRFTYGGFSDSVRIKIHPAHHNYPQSTISHFILEHLYSRSSRELRVLQELGRQDQKHLLRLLAAYDMAPKSYHLVYPCSDGNLHDFWEQFPEPKPDHSLISWLAEQAAGVASSLDFVLNQPTILDVLGQSSNHGRGVQVDPDNVLWFRDKNTDENIAQGGILQIKDFDAEFGVTRGTYRSPEFDVAGEEISQAFEIWHLGCLLLLFILWYLEGHQALDEFSHAQIGDERVDEPLPASIFFTVSVENGTKVADLKPSVRNWIQRLHRHPECSLFLHNMVDYISNRLICIEPKERDKPSEVVKELTEMAERCKADRVYACQGCPRQQSKPETVLTDIGAGQPKDDRLSSHALSQNSATGEEYSMDLDGAFDVMTDVLELGGKGEEPLTTETLSHSKGQGAKKRGLDSLPSAAASDTEMSSSGFVSPPSLPADAKRRKTQPEEGL
ncbi:Putative protein kinase [Colletotrichum destructivum]|uniref:Protein kinase domain-containing protein n=1 Tax=Colletotrichum destructivum TaxID=34406 RepID=A0AAX4J1I7_9PEZI|nr:Putative protein kinase [Colletotrichum destructivum]